MRSVAVIFAVLLAAVAAKECPASKANSKLFCYFSKLTDVDGCRCSFVILPADADVKAVEGVRGAFKGVKVLVTVNEFNQGLIDILKTSKVDGLEIDLKKLDSKSDIVDFISTVRSKLGDDLYLALSVPGKAETLAKYYDFKGLSKHADVFILQTAFLGASKNVTFHPSRLSGLWDTQNTDSMVDLVGGMGAPLSKVVITAPVQAFHFTLQDGDYSAPGSPALELKSITRKELCKEMRKDVNWTLERDQDQAGPYIFSGKNWIAFEDSSSIDVKAKYARVRGLAGLALKDVSQDDGGEECGSSVLEAASEGLSRQARAPRAAVLHSLERELQGSAHGALAGVRVSPYRISRVIDVEGHIHVVRQDTRTEFTCSRQGFFAHPRSCNRFYRCVLFDQTSDEFSVFEFDCPAGLAFDERVEVCVWPGSLPEGRPCSGSSEIAPVPRSRFVCPHEPGYYADPENCRWFFACLDHGDSPLSAYEFRCPFGLVFDSERLVCEWPWLVSRCAGSESSGYHLGQEYLHGGYSNALDQYNGLGSLGVIKLGGLSGQYHQPVVYSNVGGGAYPTASFGGIGSKATQSLVSAGLLKTGSFGYNSNLGLGSSSLNQHVGFGTSQQGSGAGSYSYTSSLGSGASSSIRESSTQANAFHNSASGGYISDTILALGDTSSFGAKSAQDLLQNSLGLADAGSTQYQGSGKEGFESYPHGSVRGGTQNENTVQLGSTQYQSSSNGLYGNHLSNSNSGSDSSNSNSKTTLSQLHYTNDGSYNGLAQSGTAQFDGSTSAGTSDRFVNFGASQYQNPNDGGATSYITNAGIDSSSSYGSHQDGNNRVVSFGSSQYQSSSDGAAALDASSLFGAKTVLDENNNGIVEQSQLQGSTYGGSGALGTSTSHFSLSSGNLGAQSSGSGSYSYSFSGQNGAKSSQAGYEGDLGTTHTREQNHQDSSLNNQVDNKAFGFTQQHFGLNSLDNLHQVQDSTQYQPSAGSINIVGGGYSAVKQSNVQITHNGEDNFGFVHTTAAPASVSTYSSVPTISSSPIAVSTYASVPTVTAVPVPTLGTPTAFGHYNGGVIANIPQLQYRYESSNASSGFVSSTPYSIPSGNEYQAASGASSYNYQSEVQGLSSNIQSEVDTSRSGGYVYNKPSVPFEEVPVPSTTVRPVELHSGFQGYRYEKPSVSFEENPLPKITTPVPVISVRPQQVTVSSTLAPVQPIIHTYRQEVQTGGYHYPKPSVTFIERPSQPTVISRFSIKKPEYQNTYVGPAVPVYNYQQPIQKTSYSFKDIVQPVSTYLPVTEKPVVLPQPVVSSYYYKKPAVSSYTFQDIVSPTTPRAVQQVYSYSTTSRPAVSYLPATEQPVVVSTYDYVTPTTAKPVVYTYTSPTPAPYVPQIVSTTPAPQLLVEKQHRVAFGGYEYPKPRVSFVEQPVEEVPFVKKTAYVTGNPVVVENYQSANYEKVKSKLFAASAGASSKSFYNSYETVSSTPAPIQQIYVQSTPRPTYYSTVASVLASKAQYDENESNFHYYDSRFSSNPAAATEGYSYPKPTVSFEEEPAVPTREYLPSTTSRPILRYSFSSLDDAHQVNVVSTASPVQTYEVPSSTREYLPVRSTVRVTTPEPTYEVPSSTLAREYLPVRSRVRVTTSEPIYEVPSSTLAREYLPVRSRVRVTTPEPTYEVPSSTLVREYLPARSAVRVTTPEPIYEVPSSTLAREYLPVRSRVRVTTPEPIYEVPSSTLAREYLPVRSRVRVTTPEPIYEVPSSTLAREYLPVRSRVRVTTPEPIYEVPSSTLTREYLPVRSRLRVTTDGNLEVSSKRPVKVVKVVRPRTKTIIKENDMHPILSAKLGAQCTCVSNTINLRKKQKIIVVEDDDEDDGYVVNNEDQGGTVVENYEYDSHSTTNEIVVPSRRERVRPEEASAVSDKEIAEAVRTGLKLVKQAAKEGAREGAEEAISNYSPRTGNAREGIECQRAGLFRHPNQCNKFYSCKWDCKKNKYALHVFDCPVHLTFDNNLGACNWPSQGPACTDDTLLPNE